MGGRHNDKWWMWPPRRYTRRTMAAGEFPLLGVGLYAVSQAAVISKVSPGRIRRWLLGYTYPTVSGYGASPPVVAPSLPPLEGALIFSFLDCQVIRFVDACF